MSKETLHFKILTPKGIVCDEYVDQVTVTTTSGEITILPNHIPLVSNLTIGQVMTRTGEKQSLYSITGGVIEKKHSNECTILSSRSDAAQDIDIQRAREAYEEAQSLMKEHEAYPDMDNYNNLKEVLTDELNRVRVGERGRRK